LATKRKPIKIKSGVTLNTAKKLLALAVQDLQRLTGRMESHIVSNGFDVEHNPEVFRTLGQLKSSVSNLSSSVANLKVDPPKRI
jgi:hypothetical protein